MSLFGLYWTKPKTMNCEGWLLAAFTTMVRIESKLALKPFIFGD